MIEIKLQSDIKIFVNIFYQIIVPNNRNKNELQKQEYDIKIMNEFWLSLRKWEIVDIFERLVKSISKKPDNRYDKRILLILNFIYKAIKYVTERDQEYQNMMENQYIVNMLLLIVKSKELMKNNYINENKIEIKDINFEI